MIDRVTQTIADILYLRATLHLPPRPIKDRKQVPDGLPQLPMAAEKVGETLPIDRVPRRSDTGVEQRAPGRWAMAMARWHFF